MARVVLENLNKRFIGTDGTDVTAVHDVTFTVEDGEFMVLVGPSGCGKSTTLRMIAGLEDITSGTVSIGDRIVNDVAPKDRDIAMVFQNYALYPHMSVFENLSFGLRLRDVPRPEIERRVQEAAQLLGLEALLDRRPKALSGGQRQRVAVGRAIVRQPKVFLFDEPLSNLDAKMRVSTRAEIAKLHARLEATMIYVTHDQVEAMTMGDRICVMNNGRVMQIDEPLRLYDEPANLFVATFIGSPPMNRFDGTVTREQNDTWFIGGKTGEIRWLLPPALARRSERYLGQPLTVGVRPEAIMPGTRAADDITVPALVDAVEPMGAETFLHLRAGSNPFVARVDPQLRPSLNETLTVAFRPEKMMLFDGRTEAVIR